VSVNAALPRHANQKLQFAAPPGKRRMGSPGTDPSGMSSSPVRLRLSNALRFKSVRRFSGSSFIGLRFQFRFHFESDLTGNDSMPLDIGCSKVIIFYALLDVPGCYWKLDIFFRDVGVAGSNPVTPTIDFIHIFCASRLHRVQQKFPSGAI
jgi:hypothetical protein